MSAAKCVLRNEQENGARRWMLIACGDLQIDFFSQTFGVKMNTEPHICRTEFGILYVYIIHYYKDSKLSS